MSTTTAAAIAALDDCVAGGPLRVRGSRIVFAQARRAERRKAREAARHRRKALGVAKTFLGGYGVAEFVTITTVSVPDQWYLRPSSCRPVNIGVEGKIGDVRFVLVVQYDVNETFKYTVCSFSVAGRQVAGYNNLRRVLADQF